MITVEEKNNARTGDAFNTAVVFIVIGSDSDAEMTKDEAIQAVVDQTTATYGTLPRLNASVGQFYLTPNRTIAEVTMQWGELDGGGESSIAEPSETGTATYEFAYQAQGYHANYALATTAYGTACPDNGLKMNVTPDGEHLGLDVPGGNTTNVWRLTFPQGFITSGYEALVEAMMGGVNGSTFKGRPAGTMRFVQCQSSLTRGGALSLAWGFHYSPNRTGLTIAGISGVNIGGHDLWSQLDEKRVDLAAGKIVLATRAIYVYQVHELVELNALGI